MTTTGRSKAPEVARLRETGFPLGVPRDAPPEAHKAMMWALWHKKMINAADMCQMTRAERFAAMDSVSASLRREDAPGGSAVMAGRHRPDRPPSGRDSVDQLSGASEIPAPRLRSSNLRYRCILRRESRWSNRSG